MPGPTLAVALLGATIAHAGVVADLSVGTAAPPAALGGYPMTAFPPDGQPEYALVSGVAAPGSEAVAFRVDLSHRIVGSSWGTWSHGYAGDARPLGEQVQAVPAPGGGAVRFCPSLTHVKVDSGWATWSHDYTGDVYFSTADSARL